MNKAVSKDIFIKNNIKTPKYFTIDRKKYKFNFLRKILKKKKLKFPIVVKPVDQGSSLGVKIIDNKKNLEKTVKSLYKKYDQLLFEQFIGGQEIQVAVINNTAIGAIELIPKRSFYDYKAKYTKAAKTQHIMPARLDKKKI